MQGQSANMYTRLTLGTFTIGAGNRIKSAQIRIRNARDAAGGTTQDTLCTLNTNLGEHFGTLTPVGNLLSTRGLTTISTVTGPLAYAGPGGKAWTQATLDDLCITVRWYQVHYGTTNVFQRVYELYCDIDINSQPTLATPTVTNFSNNAKPTVTWVYSDSDNDPQTRWRVKIFDSTTIAMSNFSADTSSPTWDSGEQIGNTDNTTVGVALQNGVTYTAYVAAAQDWAGPEGKLWWSAWAASSPFAVAFTQPAAPIINSAVALADTNQYRAVLSVTVPINLLTTDNASFEATIGNWVALTNMAAPVRDTAQHADGVASMKLSSTASGDMVAICGFDALGNPKVDGGQTYTILGQFKANTLARSCQIGVRWFDSTGAAIGADVFGASVTDSTSNFNAQASLISTTAPVNAEQGKVLAKVLATGGAAEIHWVDNVDIHVGSSTTWTPGGYSNDQGDLIVERAEYLVDDRGPAENYLHPQVASAGTLLRSAAYGFYIDTTAGGLSWKWLDKAIPSIGATPDGMLDWNPFTATTPRIGFGEWINGGTAYMVPVVALQPYAFSVWAWLNTGTMTITPRIDWRDATGALLSSSTGSNVVLTTTPQLILVTGNAAGNAILATGTIVNTNSDNGKHVYFTRIGFGPGSTAVDGKVAKGVPSGLVAGGAPPGVTWKQVRWNYLGLTTGTQGTPGLPPGQSTGQIETVIDHEYVPGRPTLYRASITYSYPAASVTVKSPYSSQVMVFGTPPPVTLLRSVTNPQLQVAVNMNETGTKGYTDDATEFHPLGADAGPIRVRDWLSGENGEIQVSTMSETQFARLLALLQSNDVMQILWKQGGRTYCIINARSYDEMVTTSINFVDADGNRSSLHTALTTLGYIETVAP
jgi:hypothetical protein